MHFKIFKVNKIKNIDGSEEILFTPTWCVVYTDLQFDPEHERESLGITGGLH